MEGFVKKAEYDFNDLCALTALLRSDNGCPWDRAQTHKSIRKNLLEEAYEVCETIDDDDSAHMCEELGDLLLQVVFHAQIEQERGNFSISDVTNGICKKLVYRHPHIFAETSENVNRNDVPDFWEKLKQQEKGYRDAYEVLKGVSDALPSLMRAEKLISKANKLKLDLDAPDIYSEKSDVELARILLGVCRAAAERNLDSEELLAKECDKMINNAKSVEKN